TPTVSLSPDLNLRIFAAGTPASEEAARAWLDGWEDRDEGARSVLIEGLTPEEAASLERQAKGLGISALAGASHGGRVRAGLSGASASLRQLGESLLLPQRKASESRVIASPVPHCVSPHQQETLQKGGVFLESGGRDDRSPVAIPSGAAHRPARSTTPRAGH